MKKLKVYINPSEFDFEQRSCIKIKHLFRDFEEIEDEHKPQIGAGASGLMPELYLFFLGVGIGIGQGFLSSLGKDLYKLIKNKIKELSKVKPKKTSLSLPRNYTGEVYSILICWFHFEDQELQVVIPLKNEHDVEKAFNQLPIAVDAIKNDKKIVRIDWLDDKWVVG